MAGLTTAVTCCALAKVAPHLEVVFWLERGSVWPPFFHFSDMRMLFESGIYLYPSYSYARSRFQGRANNIDRSRHAEIFGLRARWMSSCLLGAKTAPCLPAHYLHSVRSLSSVLQFSSVRVL